MLSILCFGISVIGYRVTDNGYRISVAKVRKKTNIRKQFARKNKLFKKNASKTQCLLS